MSDQPSRQSNAGNGQSTGIGFGVFLLVAGCALLAQQFGLLPKSIDWFFPLVLVIWGASEIYKRLR
jgi:hypothetical protein